MARLAKYSPAWVVARILAWRKTITRIVNVTEQVPTGELDKYGHPVMKTVDVVNQLCNPVTRMEFLVAPMVGDLCIYMGVSRAQWDAWVQDDAYAEAAQLMESIYRHYLDRELVTRKDVKGVIYGLEAFAGVKTPAEGGAGEFGKGRSGQKANSAGLTIKDKARLLEQVAKDFRRAGDDDDADDDASVDG